MYEIIWNPPVPQTVKSFKVTFGSMTIPVEEIKGIVDNNFECWNPDLRLYEGFNKINAIKELRSHFQLLTNRDYTMYGPSDLFVGLREAKEMIEAVLDEGIDAGNYRAACSHTDEERSLVGKPDDLPF